MTNLGAKYNSYMVVSCEFRADNRNMTNFQTLQNPQNVSNTAAVLRAAYGPGLQFGGPTESALRAITGQHTR